MKFRRKAYLLIQYMFNQYKNIFSRKKKKSNAMKTFVSTASLELEGELTYHSKRNLKKDLVNPTARYCHISTPCYKKFISRSYT